MSEHLPETYYLDPEVLQSLGDLELVAREVVEERIFGRRVLDEHATGGCGEPAGECGCPRAGWPIDGNVAVVGWGPSHRQATW